MQEVINMRNIRNHIEANTWQEAIQEAGNLLIEDNKITQNYVESMIHSVYEMGPYMVLMPGFALVHAAPSEA
ncbi:MAG: PTS sugar transporter subunit IIA, partial [Anaerorhabdus sp.]